MARSGSHAQSSELFQLNQMFPSIDEDIVSDVLAACGKDQKKAIERLLQISKDGKEDSSARIRHSTKGRESLRKPEVAKPSKSGQPDEGHRIRSKYPTRVPVICTPPEGVSTKPCKLLVPGLMTCLEFAKIARDKCTWATEESEPFVNGACVPLSAIMSTLDEQYKSPDGFFYVTISTKAPLLAESKTPLLDFDAQDGESKPAPVSVFHMPDADPVSADASQVKRVLRKYPDRVPVLFKQSPMSGLPAIDKKLLVPHNMLCDELKCVLKKHSPAPIVDVDWERFCIVVAGDVKLKSHTCIKEVYDDYKDTDGCLHISLGDSTALEADLLPECTDFNLMETIESPLASGVEKESLEADLAAARERADTAQEAIEEAESRATIEAEKAKHFAQAYLEVSEKNVHLEEAVEAAQNAQEKAQREAEKSAGIEAYLKVAEEQRDTEARKAEEVAFALKEVERKASVEAERAERAEVAEQEAEQKATLQATKTAEVSSRLEAIEELLATERSAKAAVESDHLKLKQSHEELQKRFAQMQSDHEKCKQSHEELPNVQRRAEAAEKRASELALKVACAEDASKVATDKLERAELARKAAEAALEAQKAARTRASTEEAEGFTMCGSSTDATIEDWALM